MMSLRADDWEIYVDDNFDWSFSELTSTMKKYIDDDAKAAIVRMGLHRPVNFYRINGKKEVNISQESSARSDDMISITDATDDYAVRKYLKPTDFPLEKIEELKKNIDEWDFDIFILSHLTKGHAMQAVAHEIFSRENLLSAFHLSEDQFMRFTIQTERHYKHNPYHNSTHATDVLQSVYCIIVQTGFKHYLTANELFCLLVTALLHDVEHTGTNNNFHTNSGSELAKLYVVSILENHHIRVGLKLLHEFDILSKLSKDDFRDFKDMLTSMILSTNMANHFLLMTNMKLMRQTTNRGTSRLRLRRILMLILHAADINNPAKPWNLHKVWVTLLCEEFFQQGDKERDMKLPVSPNCDRNVANIATLQIGFMQTFAKETFDVLNELLEPPIGLSSTLRHSVSVDAQSARRYDPWSACMAENFIKWSGKWRSLKYDQINELLEETKAPRHSVMPVMRYRASKKRSRLSRCSCCQCDDGRPDEDDSSYMYSSAP